MIRKLGFAALFVLVAPLSVQAVIVNQIDNGDFETGTFASWTPGGASIVPPGTPLAGSFSAEVGGGDTLSQSLDAAVAITSDPFVTSFLFSMPDPGGASDRGLNLLLAPGTSSPRINVRVVDEDDDGDGDVQVFSGSWGTVLADAVDFDSTELFTLTINSIGAGTINYDISVDGNTASGLTGQHVPGSAITTLVFEGDLSAVSYVVDNVEAGFDVEPPTAPEPSSALLAIAGLIGLSLRRRRWSQSSI